MTLVSGVTMGFILLYIKFENPEAAFTHTLNELRYYINCGIVVLICAAAFIITPNHKLALTAFLSTIPLHLIIIYLFPEMNYFVRAMWVILIAFAIVSTSIFIGARFKVNGIVWYASPRIAQMGLGLLFSLGVLHLIFH